MTPNYGLCGTLNCFVYRMGLLIVVLPGEGRSAFQIYGKTRARLYSYYIGILVTVAFLETKLLELKPTSLSRMAQLKLDFFNMLVQSRS